MTTLFSGEIIFIGFLLIVIIGGLLEIRNRLGHILDELRETNWLTREEREPRMTSTIGMWDDDLDR